MIVVQTPLRVSFLGGGTDFDDFYLNHGSAVLSTAIDKHVYVIIKKRFDDLIYVNYSRKETVDSVDKLEHELVRESMKATGVSKGVEITTLSDIPSEGTGLGSSSAVTVGLLHNLYTYQDRTVTAKTLAEQACHIEIDILKKPIGRQDQYIAAYGDLRFITFDDGGIEVERVPLSPDGKNRLNHAFLLFYTGVTRKSHEVLAEQKSNIAQNVTALCEMKKLAYRAKDAIVAGALDDFGEIMHQGWELKKTLASKVTNPDIDDLYQVARKAGAIGGKITGAGGGGFLLLYCRNGRQDEVRSALGRLREVPFRLHPFGSRVIFDYRGAG